LGADDAVKVWLNGALIHAKNVARPVTPWEDQVDIVLPQGVSTLLLKVVQGGGGWGACARIRTRDGADIEGLQFDPSPIIPEGVTVPDVVGESTGTIVTWDLAGPYFQEGTRGAELFDVVFPPEDEGADGTKWEVVNEHPRVPRPWKLVQGNAMEVIPGAGSMVSKRVFGDQRIHVEFRTPFKPTARGQGRGNSGVYVQRRYEIQVLDSYGLEGKSNECGGIYKRAAPRVNMCAPPLQWQTFDIEFRAARLNEGTGKMDEARMTVRHNGVLIHEDVRLPARTKGGPGAVESGPILLQDHGNHVQYRNIWVQER
jgi:hypothetical protein